MNDTDDTPPNGDRIFPLTEYYDEGNEDFDPEDEDEYDYSYVPASKIIPKKTQEIKSDTSSESGDEFILDSSDDEKEGGYKRRSRSKRSRIKRSRSKRSRSKRNRSKRNRSKRSRRKTNKIHIKKKYN